MYCILQRVRTMSDSISRKLGQCPAGVNKVMQIDGCVGKNTEQSVQVTSTCDSNEINKSTFGTQTDVADIGVIKTQMEKLSVLNDGGNNNLPPVPRYTHIIIDDGF